jgi:hypothetical protein
MRAMQTISRSRLRSVPPSGSNRLAVQNIRWALAVVFAFAGCSAGSGASGNIDAAAKNSGVPGGQSGQSGSGGAVPSPDAPAGGKGGTGGASPSGGSSVSSAGSGVSSGGSGSGGGAAGGAGGGAVAGSGGVRETGGVSGSSDSGSTGPIAHRTLISGSGTLSIIGPTGKLEWTGSGGGYDCWLLANGNIVHAYTTGAREIKPDYVSGKGGTVIWDRPTVDGETHSCQPLEENRYVLAESHPGGISYIVEIDRSKTELKKLKIPFPATETAHTQLRQVRKLPSGNYLYCEQHGDGVEIDPTGKELHRYPSCTFEALRLTNGNTLVSGGYSNQILEYDQDIKVVWQVTPAEFKAMGVNANFIAGVVRLDNGDTVFSNYGASAADANVFQITKEKKLVWSLKQPKNAGDTGTTTVCRILDGIPFPPAATP